VAVRFDRIVTDVCSETAEFLFVNSQLTLFKFHKLALYCYLFSNSLRSSLLVNVNCRRMKNRINKIQKAELVLQEMEPKLKTTQSKHD